MKLSDHNPRWRLATHEMTPEQLAEERAETAEAFRRLELRQFEPGWRYPAGPEYARWSEAIRQMMEEP